MAKQAEAFFREAVPHDHPTVCSLLGLAAPQSVERSHGSAVQRKPGEARRRQWGMKIGRGGRGGHPSRYFSP